MTGSPHSFDTLRHKLKETLAASPRAGLVSVYLFGSVVRGTSHRESDIDIAALLDWELHPAPRDRFEAGLELSAWLQSVLRSDAVDLVVLNDAPPLFGRRIVIDGERMFCADELADSAFRRDVQLRAADLQPFLTRMARIKLEALRS